MNLRIDPGPLDLPLATSRSGVRYQHTMKAALHWLVVLAAVSLFACGDDAASGGGTMCMDGAKSMPGAAGDPCPQSGTACAAQAGKAVACCAGTSWAIDPMTMRTKCQCETTAVPVTCGAGGAATCGNGMIDATEQCDGTMLGAMGTCMALGMGSGTLSCDPTTCRYDMSMCMGMTNTGGTGGGGTGGS
jgi:hypothetical protein